MRKKLLAILLVVAVLTGCFSIGLGSMVSQARGVGVGTGAESFNPVNFSVAKEVLIGSDVNTTLNVEILNKDYKVKINSITAYIPYYLKGGISYLDVAYEKGTVVTDVQAFAVTGSIADNVNSVVRYTVEYDILDNKDQTVWKNLTGYTYAFVSSNESTTGALGANHANPGQLSDGCYFEELVTLNTTYVQQDELSLSYKIRTQTGYVWNYSDPRTRGVNVISGNAPSTLITMPDNTGAPRVGQMDWPKADAVYRSASGDWLRMSEPESGYYNFTISFNSWGDEWEDQSNITETTEMYYIRSADRVNAYNAANKIMKTSRTFSDGYYVQKGKYTEDSWNNLISALDIAYQVALSVPGANYGYKLACSNAQQADEAVDAAFANLVEAEHDFYTYKDPVVKAATCTEAGTQFVTCICGEEKVVDIEALGHTNGDWEALKEATCTEQGYEGLRCIDCNELIKERVTPIIAHNYEMNITAPTCTEQGYTTFVCAGCSVSYIGDYVDETGHNYNEATVAPTCTEKGYTVYSCSQCSDRYMDNYVDENGHNLEKTVYEPTETEQGYIVYQCSECEYNYIEDFVSDSEKGVVVSGKVQSFLEGTNADGMAETTLELIKDGETLYTTSVSGIGVQDYSFEYVANGTYTLKVSKLNHATREYEITVDGENVTNEVKIHLKGDIDGNGIITVIDYATVLRHVTKTDLLEGYELACGDIDDNEKITVVDYAKILNHVNKIELLW